MLCDTCNGIRLNANSPNSHATLYIRRGGLSDKGKAMILKDEEFYELLWNSKPHYCEECDIFLGDDFRDENGNVINRFRYSHILPKGGQYGEFRHRLENGNLLCLKHHEEWEHGDRTSMRIYQSNKPIIELMLNELILKNGKEIEK